MALTPQKIEQAKKLFGVSDADITRIVSGGGQSQQQPSQPKSTPQPQQPIDAGSTGTFLGSLLGTAGGPIGRMAGASAGAGALQQASEMTQGGQGDPMAALSPVNPLFAMLNAAPHALSQLKGEEPKLSSVEKAQRSGAKNQFTGEALAGILSLLKPGTTSKIFSDITDFFSKQGKGEISKDVIKTRFLNETLPKALQSGGVMREEPVVRQGEKILGDVSANVLDSEELNFIRKQLNSVGKGTMTGDLKKFIANDLARIVKDEQLKLAPAAKVGIAGGKLSRQIPNIFRQLPFGRFFLGTGASNNEGLLGLLGSGTSAIGKNLSRYVLPSMMQKE